jgi:hypothetical protein
VELYPLYSRGPGINVQIQKAAQLELADTPAWLQLLFST